MIYLLPWKFDTEGGCFKRMQLGKEIVIASIWKEASNGKWYSSHLNIEESYDSFEEICEKVDKRLSTYRDLKTAKKLYYVIKQNEMERFEKKLKLLL